MPDVRGAAVLDFRIKGGQYVEIMRIVLSSLTARSGQTLLVVCVRLSFTFANTDWICMSPRGCCTYLVNACRRPSCRKALVARAFRGGAGQSTYRATVTEDAKQS